MKPFILPIISGLLLVSMSAGVLAHWWSVNSFIALTSSQFPVSTVVVRQPLNAAQPAWVAPQSIPKKSELTLEGQESQKIILQTLTNFNKKFEALQIQNRDLLDQLAETNRDVMKLEFRVDTHSESFRPMPVSEEQATTYDSGSGVLPLRAEPVFLPNDNP
jgi:hypothetical protein